MPFDANYANRIGYDVAFLRSGKRDGRVFLPILSDALAKQAAPLLGMKSRAVLDYHHYSLVMHKARRFAIYSAANVDFSGRFAMTRPKDVWRIDPRISVSAQVTAACYENNQFDRGHLTRREDLEYGVDKAAARASADDTCHWTNCTPQAASFNEGRQLWAGLELHILEAAVAKDSFRAQVFTGPIFDDRDPPIPGFADTHYPLRYWKVVSAINASSRLFATAYVLDQRPEIRAGMRGAPEIPFGPYKTFQTTIANVEKLTGLAFLCGHGAKRVPLSELDPLVGTRSATAYLPISSLDQVVLKA